MPHRPNPIPRFNNQQYASNSPTGGQSTSSNVQNASHSGANSSRRDLNSVPPRHRGHSFSATPPPSVANQDGNTTNRGERTSGGSHRTLPPPRFQRKRRPPRVQNTLAGLDNVDGSLSTLTFGPATNWGVGTQSVVSLPMAAVNAASSTVAPSASRPIKAVPSSNSTLTPTMDDLPSDFATRGFTQSGVDPTNDSPFGKSGCVPYSTSLPNPPSYMLSLPSHEDSTTGSCAPSVLAPYFTSAMVTMNGDYALDEPRSTPPSISTVQPLSCNTTPTMVDTISPALKHQLSNSILVHAVYPSSVAYSVTPVLSASAHNPKFFDGQVVNSCSCSPYVGGLEYEQDVIGADEDGLHATDEESIHPSHGAGLDEWEEFDEALKMYAAGLVDDEDCPPVLPPLAPRPVVRVSLPSRGSNPPPTAVPTGFAESTALTRTARSRPVSTLDAHAHRIPPHIPQLRIRSRSPSPTLSGNGSCESAGSMGSLPGLGSFGSGSTGGSKLSLQSTSSSRPFSIFSNNASMASLTSRSTISSGRSLRTVDSYGSLRSTASGVFGGGSLLVGTSIWAMDKEEAGVGVSIGTVGVAGRSTLSLVPEEGPGFSGKGYGLPKGAAPALEPFGAFEPTPRRKNRPVGGFSNATLANLPKMTARSAFHAHAPSEVPDDPFASMEAIRGSPPLQRPPALTHVTQHVPLIPMGESLVTHKGMVVAIPSKQDSGLSLSGNAKAFIPRSSTIHDVQFSDIPFENPGRVPGRKVEGACVGTAGIIDRGVRHC